MSDKVSRSMLALGVGFLVLALLSMLGGSPAGSSLESLSYPVVLFTATAVYEVALRVARRREARAFAAQLRTEPPRETW